ncbi:unnamed protein product [Effrenium voratum]|nr:unnamed protein product [Effrenium voratum]CAJ1424040.1 unnamed protein product [Effrenium voratum]
MRPDASPPDVIVRPGTVVQVLPGRQFPAFSAGDMGVVKRVDTEGRTCDVLFDHNIAAGPLPVATRHLGLVNQDISVEASDGHARRMSDRSRALESLGAMSCSPNDVLEAQLASQQYTLNSFEARLAACEAALGGDNGKSGRLVAARVAALEAAHQAEANELKRALNEAVSVSREQETLHRKHRNTGRDLEQLSTGLEQRFHSLQETARRVEDLLPNLTNAINSQERRAQDLREVVTSSSNGISEIANLLESQERRTFDLAEAVSNARRDLAQLSSRLEDSGQSIQRLSEQLRRDREPREAPSLEAQEDAIWKSLRELQELVVHESEHRAAGLREVLSVIGRDTEQLRSELSRHEAEIEGRYKADSLKIKQHIGESQARLADHEQLSERLEKRLDALSNALTAERNARIEAFVWLEEKARFVGHSSVPSWLFVKWSEVRDSQTGPSLAPGRCSAHLSHARICHSVTSALRGTPPAPSSPPRITRIEPEDNRPVVAQSLSRLKVLEARFDHRKPPAISPGVSDSVSPRQGTTGETIEKLRGQLDGLRAELRLGGQPEAAFASPRQPIVRQAEARSISPSLAQATPPVQRRIVYSQPAIPVASAAMSQVSGTTVGVDPSKNGKGDFLVSGSELSDLEPPRVIYSYPVMAQSLPAQAAPTATVGLDLNRDGRADVLVSGVDLNYDGIPDCLQSEAAPPGMQTGKVTLCTGPAKGYIRPAEFSIATFGAEARPLEPQQALRCWNCNNEILADAKFCRMCGQRCQEQTIC